MSLNIEEMKLVLPGGGGGGSDITRGWGFRRHGAKLFCSSRIFFYIQFKNTSNLILLSFKVPSESFFTRFSKQVLFFEICGFKK